MALSAFFVSAQTLSRGNYGLPRCTPTGSLVAPRLAECQLNNPRIRLYAAMQPR
jgi:hypothetical protein